MGAGAKGKECPSPVWVTAEGATQWKGEDSWHNVRKVMVREEKIKMQK